MNIIALCPIWWWQRNFLGENSIVTVMTTISHKWKEWNFFLFPKLWINLRYRYEQVFQRLWGCHWNSDASCKLCDQNKLGFFWCCFHHWAWSWCHNIFVLVINAVHHFKEICHILPSSINLEEKWYIVVVEENGSCISTFRTWNLWDSTCDCLKVVSWQNFIEKIINWIILFVINLKIT